MTFVGVGRVLAGVVLCIGCGGGESPAVDGGADDAGPDNCGTAPACPSPGAGEVAVCGRVHDGSSGAYMPGSADLLVSAFDGIDVAGNGLEAATLLAGADVDSCRYYQLV